MLFISERGLRGKAGRELLEALGTYERDPRGQRAPRACPSLVQACKWHIEATPGA